MTATSSTKPLPFGIDKTSYNRKKIEAGYCYFYYFWGNDLMFSTGFAVRECKLTGNVSSWTFGVEINPKGPTAFDEWKQSCWDYIPTGQLLSYEQLAAMPNTSWSHLGIEGLKKRFAEEMENLEYQKTQAAARPVLKTHWAWGTPAKLKKINRQIWRQTYKQRKALKIGEREFFQLRLRGLFPC
jgi:hypothetical protein